MRLLAAANLAAFFVAGRATRAIFLEAEACISSRLAKCINETDSTWCALSPVVVQRGMI